MAVLTYKPLSIDPETQMHTLNKNSPVKLTSENSGTRFYFHELNTGVNERFYITTILNEGEESIIGHECGRKGAKSADILYIHISCGKEEITCHIYDAKRNPTHEKDLLGLVDKWIETVRLVKEIAADIHESACVNYSVGVIAENTINYDTIAYYIDSAYKELSKNDFSRSLAIGKSKRSQISPTKRIKIFRQILEHKIEIDGRIYEIMERTIINNEHRIVFMGPVMMRQKLTNPPHTP